MKLQKVCHTYGNLCLSCIQNNLKSSKYTQNVTWRNIKHLITWYKWFTKTVVQIFEPNIDFACFKRDKDVPESVWTLNLFLSQSKMGWEDCCIHIGTRYNIWTFFLLSSRGYSLKKCCLLLIRLCYIQPSWNDKLLEPFLANIIWMIWFYYSL